MAKFTLTIHSQQRLSAYIAVNHLTPFEKSIFDEIMEDISQNDSARLAWFAGFGDSFLQMAMNVHAHRRALEFGFAEASFNLYGWSESLKFQDSKVLPLGKVKSAWGGAPIVCGLTP